MKIAQYRFNDKRPDVEISILDIWNIVGFVYFSVMALGVIFIRNLSFFDLVCYIALFFSPIIFYYFASYSRVIIFLKNQIVIKSKTLKGEVSEINDLSEIAGIQIEKEEDGIVGVYSIVLKRKSSPSISLLSEIKSLQSAQKIIDEINNRLELKKIPYKFMEETSENIKRKIDIEKEYNLVIL